MGVMDANLDGDPMEARRQEVLTAISPGYSGMAHLVAVLGIGLAFLVVPLGFLRHVQPWQLCMVPISLVFANLVEYLVHKGPLHHPVTPRILYNRHTLVHHVAFTHQHMEIRHMREVRFVLFPLFALPALEAVVVLPVVLLLWGLGQRNLALLFVSVGAFYYLTYEILHLCYHLPEGHWFGGLRFIRWLGGHHRTHHNIRRMTDGNFNVSIPLWDFILGTWLAPDLAHAEVKAMGHNAGAEDARG